VSLTEDVSSEVALAQVSYESVASIIRQCKQEKKTYRIDTLQANAAYPRPRRLTPAQLQEKKNKSMCHREGCGKYGHWLNDHKPDGSLKPGVKSYDCPQGVSTPNESGSQRQSTNLAKKVSFNMVHLSNDSNLIGSPIGPLLDDGAPYSGIGEEEFNMIQKYVCPEWTGGYGMLPDIVKNRPYWQYGIGSHASKSRRIIGSVVITARSDQGGDVSIRHLVIQGSSQWIIGRNVTSSCNMVRIGRNVLELPGNSGTVSLVNHDLHCYVPFETFCAGYLEPLKVNAVMFCATSKLDDAVEKRPWSEVKAIIDKIHRHICGHST